MNLNCICVKSKFIVCYMSKFRHVSKLKSSVSCRDSGNGLNHGLMALTGLEKFKCLKSTFYTTTCNIKLLNIFMIH